MERIKAYMAPLEGITMLIFRNAVRDVFGNDPAALRFADRCRDIRAGLLQRRSDIEPFSEIKAVFAFGEVDLRNLDITAVVKNTIVRESDHTATPLLRRMSSTSSSAHW